MAFQRINLWNSIPGGKCLDLHCCKCQLSSSHCQLEWRAVFILPRKLHRLIQHMVGGCEAILFLVHLNHAPFICPSFSPVSHLQIFQSYDEMLTASFSWAVSFPGLLCWAGISMAGPTGGLGREGSKREGRIMWADGRMWSSWRDWTTGQAVAISFPCTWK